MNIRYGLGTRAAIFGGSLALAGLPVAARAQSATPPAVSAQPGYAQAWVTRYSVLDALPQTTRAEALAHPPIPRPAAGISDREYQARKARAAVLPFSTNVNDASGPGPAPARSGGSETPVGTKDFAGGNEACSNLTPADMGLAVSPQFVLQLVNSCVYVFKPDGTLTLGYPKSFDAFLGLPSSAFTFDPRAIYDAVNKRFITAIDQFDTANNIGYVWVSISATANPRGLWYHYKMSFGSGSSGSAPDFPTLGQDRVGVYVGANVFGAANGGFTSFQQNQMLLLPKAALEAGSGFSYRFFTNLSIGGVLVDSTQPANTSDTTDSPRAEFMISSRNINFGGGQCSSSACNGVVVWALSNQLDTKTFFPELSGINVATAHNYMLPPQAHQSGGPNTIDTGDTRISGEVAYSHGTLYGSLNTKNNAGLGSVLWFQIQPVLNDNDARCTGSFTNACPQITSASILNEDCFYCGGEGTNGSSYYAVVRPDLEGNATMVYSYSDDNSWPGVVYTSRRATQGPNTFHDAGFFLTAGAHSYTGGRWGDYDGATLQEVAKSTGVVWFSAMNALSNGNWGTSIGANAFTAVTQP